MALGQKTKMLTKDFFCLVLIKDSTERKHVENEEVRKNNNMVRSIIGPCVLLIVFVILMTIMFGVLVIIPGILTVISVWVFKREPVGFFWLGPMLFSIGVVIYSFFWREDHIAWSLTIGVVAFWISSMISLLVLNIFKK